VRYLRLMMVQDGPVGHPGLLYSPLRLSDHSGHSGATRPSSRLMSSRSRGLFSEILPNNRLGLYKNTPLVFSCRSFIAEVPLQPLLTSIPPPLDRRTFPATSLSLRTWASSTSSEGQFSYGPPLSDGLSLFFMVPFFLKLPLPGNFSAY